MGWKLIGVYKSIACLLQSDRPTSGLTTHYMVYLENRTYALLAKPLLVRAVCVLIWLLYSLALNFELFMPASLP